MAAIIIVMMMVTLWRPRSRGGRIKARTFGGVELGRGVLEWVCEGGFGGLVCPVGDALLSGHGALAGFGGVIVLSHGGGGEGGKGRGEGEGEGGDGGEGEGGWYVWLRGIYMR
jgi:hypothetical protein